MWKKKNRKAVDVIKFVFLQGKLYVNIGWVVRMNFFEFTQYQNGINEGLF
jgi:hypothetical protein